MKSFFARGNLLGRHLGPALVQRHRVRKPLLGTHDVDRRFLRCVCVAARLVFGRPIEPEVSRDTFFKSPRDVPFDSREMSVRADDGLGRGMRPVEKLPVAGVTDGAPRSRRTEETRERLCDGVLDDPKSVRRRIRAGTEFDGLKSTRKPRGSPVGLFRDGNSRGPRLFHAIISNQSPRRLSSRKPGMMLI